MVRDVSEANIIDLCSSIKNETSIALFRKNDTIENKWDSFHRIFNYRF
jgi:hypothetical protein